MKAAGAALLSIGEFRGLDLLLPGLAAARTCCCPDLLLLLLLLLLLYCCMHTTYSIQHNTAFPLDMRLFLTAAVCAHAGAALLGPGGAQRGRLGRALRGSGGVQCQQPLPQARLGRCAHQVWHLLHHQVLEPGAAAVWKRITWFDRPEPKWGMCNCCSVSSSSLYDTR